MPRVTSAHVFRIAVPMMLAFMSTPLLGMVDTAVVGRLGSARLSGGIAVGALFFDFLYSMAYFLRSGTTALAAQALGRNDTKEQAAVVRRALVIAVACGLAMVALSSPLQALGLWIIGPDAGTGEAAASYINARIVAAPFTLVNYCVLGFMLGQGRSGLGLALQTLLNGANIVLSILLVAGLGLGVAGSGYAAAVSECVTAFAGLAYVFAGRHGPQPSWAEVLHLPALRAMFAVNRDIMIRTLCLMAAFTLFTRFGAAEGEVALAANAILLQFFLLGGYFLDGFANAAEQMAAQATGARDRAAFLAAVRLSLMWGFAFAGLVSLALVAGGHQLIALMTAAKDVQASAATYMLWGALSPLAGVLAFGMDGIFIGATWASAMRNMMLLSLAMFVALLAVLPPLLGNNGLWLAFSLFLLVRGISLAAAFPRCLRAAFPERPA